MNNIVENHITKTQRRFKRYCNLILRSKYDKKVCDELIQTYIDARYYNYNVDDEIKIFYRRIFESLKLKAQKMIKEDKSKEELVENTLSLFQYFFYFDFVRKNVELSEVVRRISEKRINEFNLKSAQNDDFEKTFNKLVKQDIKEVENTLKAYNSNEFELDINKIIPSNNNYYRVKLKYNFTFPEVYSIEAIEETFNSDLISEDKLFVEYPMIAIKSLKDILDGNFAKIYIVDFSTDLLNKKQKLDQILKIVESQAVQDKINFEITYKDFLENKSKIYELVKRGFNFCLKTEEEMPKLKQDELKILDIFNCIIVDTNDVNKSKYKKILTLEV